MKQSSPKTKAIITKFLKILFGKNPSGYLPIWTKQPNETPWVSGQQLNEATDLAHNLAQTRDVYFGLGLQPRDLGKRSRGKADQVIAIPGVWADIDIADAAHKNQNLPSSIEEAMSLISEIPLAPTLVVNSGHGMHVYWLFKNLWVFQDAEEREHAQTVVRAFQAGLIHLGHQRGWTMDNTSDLARVLRIPGTMNRKREPVPVSIIEQNLAHRYQPSDFEEVFKKELPSLSEQDNKITVQPDLDFSALPPADLAPIVEGCAWLAHCQQDAQTLAEPEWYAMLSIVGRCENGATLAQEWSASYPDYSREETDTKFDRALTQGGPRKCDNIQQMTGGRFCQDCSHAGTITSPIQLGNQNALSPEERKLIDHPVAELNKTHAVIMIGGQCRILNEEINPSTGYPTISFSNLNDFKTRYAPYRTVSGEKKACIADIWFHSTKRRQYEGLTFMANGIKSGFYNLWKGFGVVPKEGDCRLFLDHIRDTIAKGNPDIYRYIIEWMAHTVQRPDQRIDVAIVLRGKQGTGKGIMCTEFGKLFGSHFTHVQHSRHLVGHFNAHLKQAVVVFADEAFWGGNKECEGPLKTMVTEEQMSIEYKGKDAISVRNYIHLLIASNTEWVVPAGLQERRFCVLDVGEDRMQDHAYFENLTNQMDNGGREALLHYLLHYDLAGVNLRAFPQTEALMEQKLQSMNDVQRFWLDKLMEGTLSRQASIFGKGCISKKELYDQYIQHAQKEGQARRSAETKLGMGLRKLVPGLQVETTNILGPSDKSWVFPRLKECREAFDRMVNYSFPWPDDGGHWINETPEADEAWEINEAPGVNANVPF